jgi:hypothetical protein
MSFQQIIGELPKTGVGCGLATSVHHRDWTLWAWKPGRPVISSRVRSTVDAWMWLHQHVVQGYLPLQGDRKLDDVLERLRYAHIPHGVAVLPRGELLVWLGEGRRPSHVTAGCEQAVEWLDRAARKHYGRSKYTAA